MPNTTIMTNSCGEKHSARRAARGGRFGTGRIEPRGAPRPPRDIPGAAAPALLLLPAPRTAGFCSSSVSIVLRPRAPTGPVLLTCGKVTRTFPI